MKRGPTVLVCGTDEGQIEATASELADRGGFNIRTDADLFDELDCIVSLDADVPPPAQSYQDRLPLIVFDDADPETVQELLTDPRIEYVQQDATAAHAVLIDRIESVRQRAPAAGVFDGYGKLVESLDDGVYALDDKGQFVFANEALAELTGYDTEELLGEHTSFIKDQETVELAESKLATLLSSTGPDTIGTTFELELYRKDGTTIACEDHMTVLYGPDEEFRGTAGIIRDISERKRREQLLSALQETSRSLMQAPSREDVAKIVADATQRVLGLESAVVRLYDADEQVLRPAAVTDAVGEQLGDRPVLSLGDGQSGEVFATGESITQNTEHALDGTGVTMQSGIYVPIGVHGTLAVFSPDSEAFDDIDRQVVGLLATNAAAACNRAKREQEVREARTRIETILDRINGLIENTVEVLVESTTREAVESGVCAELASTDPYTFAWIARPGVRDEQLEIRAWAGDAPIAMDDDTLDLTPETPGATALADETSRVIDDLDTLDSEWAKRAREAGVASMMAIPLSYTDSTYGVLCVCSDQANAFDQREQVVLGALGRAVANAINAIESGKILSADKVIELEFTINDRSLLVSRVSAATEATLTSSGIVTQDDGSLQIYLTAEGADSDTIADELSGDDSVRSVTQVADHEGSALFEIVIEESLLATLVDHGAVPKSISAENGIARYTIELPYEADARELFSLVEDNYDGTDLVGYHEHERPVQTQQEFQSSLSERFTDRQETALRTAFLGGFFNWPREADGDDLAEAMDISRPTYHQHLRAAQQKVYEELFET
jgi:PAS domain S-box-containing protein